MIDIEVVKGNLGRRDAGSLLRVFCASLSVNFPEIFLGYKRSEAGNNAGQIQDLVIKEFVVRGRERIGRMQGRVKNK